MDNCPCQIDPDVVALDDGSRRCSIDLDGVATISENDVAQSNATDKREVRAAIDVDTGSSIPQNRCPISTQSDEVILNDVYRGSSNQKSKFHPIRWRQLCFSTQW